MYKGSIANTNLGILKITASNGVLSKIDFMLIKNGISETTISPAIAI